jgi:hypothetical protein
MFPLLSMGYTGRTLNIIMLVFIHYNGYHCNAADNRCLYIVAMLIIKRIKKRNILLRFFIQ